MQNENHIPRARTPSHQSSSWRNQIRGDVRVPPTPNEKEMNTHENIKRFFCNF